MAEIGCICCRMAGVGFQPTQIHHLLDGGVRRGHSMTIGLCPYHHTGSPETPGVGPSLAHGSQSFHFYFGSDSELLEYQNTLLAQVGK